MEIIPGVHRIDGVRGANCYLVTSGTELVLIDAGMRGSSKKIESYLKTMGKSPSDIKYIFITHADPDHISGSTEMKKLTGEALSVSALLQFIPGPSSPIIIIESLICIVACMMPFPTGLG